MCKTHESVRRSITKCFLSTYEPIRLFCTYLGTTRLEPSKAQAEAYIRIVLDILRPFQYEHKVICFEIYVHNDAQCTPRVHSPHPHIFQYISIFTANPWFIHDTLIKTRCTVLLYARWNDKIGKSFRQWLSKMKFGCSKYGVEFTRASQSGFPISRNHVYCLSLFSEALAHDGFEMRAKPGNYGKLSPDWQRRLRAHLRSKTPNPAYDTNACILCFLVSTKWKHFIPYGHHYIHIKNYL